MTRTGEAEEGQDHAPVLAPAHAADPDPAGAIAIAPGAAPSPGAGASPETGPGPSPARGLALVATTNGRTGTEGESLDQGASPEAAQDRAAGAAIKRKTNQQVQYTLQTTYFSRHNTPTLPPHLIHHRLVFYAHFFMHTRHFNF